MNKCVCCEIPLQGKGNHQSTMDHILLRSLGGPTDMTNMNYMCRQCNSMRGNNFAEQEEFIQWYYSFEKMPARNFCYLHEKPRNKKHKASKTSFLRLGKRQNKSCKEGNKDVLCSSSKVNDVLVDGVVYVEYQHPVYGKSMIKKDTI